MGVYSLTKSSIKNWVKYSSMMAGSSFLVPASDDLITQTVLGSSAASITFDVSTLAAQGYKHLQIRYVARSAYGSGEDGLLLRFNSDASNTYAVHILEGRGASVGSYNGIPRTSVFMGAVMGNTGTASVFSAGVVDIVDAFGFKNKTVRTFTGMTGNNYVALNSSLWPQTTSPTAISVFCGNGDLVTGSRFSLYASKG